MVASYVPEPRSSSDSSTEIMRTFQGDTDSTVPENVSSPSPPLLEEPPPLSDVIDESTAAASFSPVHFQPDSDLQKHSSQQLDESLKNIRREFDDAEEKLGVASGSKDDVLVTDPDVTERTALTLQAIGLVLNEDATTALAPEQPSEDHLESKLRVLDDFRKSLADVGLRYGPPLPVMDGSLLDRALSASLDLIPTGIDNDYKQCTNFYQEHLPNALNKLVCDDGVSSWTTETQKALLHRCMQAMQIVAAKVPQDSTALLDLMGTLLNSHTRFLAVSSSRVSETYPKIILPPSRGNFGGLFSTSSSELNKIGDTVPEDDIIPADVYARSFDSRNPRGIQVDLLNAFGRAGGFAALHKRIVEDSKDNPMTISLLVAWLKPFGLCADHLTAATVDSYFSDVFETVPQFLETMPDADFKKESGKQDGKSDPFTVVIKALKSLVKVVPQRQNSVSHVIESARLSTLFKLLKVSTYNGKMHALNEINKMITSLSYTHRPFSDDEATLSPERIANWLRENSVLTIIMSDCMHQPQYVEKLEKIIRFMIKERSLTSDDLDTLWCAQNGKHEAIVKNVHDLLTKLAWEFHPEQLDCLFGHFQESWVSASRRQREKLLDLIRRLAEDDKEGVMALKVLELLWSLCQNDELPQEIMEQALAAHLKILDFNCTHEKDRMKFNWLKKCLNEVKDNHWVVPALKHMENICEQFPEIHTGPSITSSIRHSSASRADAVNWLISGGIVDIVIKSLQQYLELVRSEMRDRDPRTFDPQTTDALGSKFPHIVQVESRLSFLRYVLQRGNQYLPNPDAIWSCMAEEPSIDIDREMCFRWFTQAMSRECDLEQNVIGQFFQHKILRLDASFLTASGIKCFDGFFRSVNTQESKLKVDRSQLQLSAIIDRSYLLIQYDLIGLDYLWDIILNCKEEIAQMGIDIFRDLYTCPCRRSPNDVINLHKEFKDDCMSRLRPLYDTLSNLDSNEKAYHNKITQDTNKAVRILRVIIEYVRQYDQEFTAERGRPPLGKAAYGRGFNVALRGSANSRTSHIGGELMTHTNETVASFRRQIYQKFQIIPTAKLDLYLNNDLLSNDRKLMGELDLREPPVITVKYSVASYQSGVMSDVTSPESSSDISPASPDTDFGEEINMGSENLLPGLWLSSEAEFTQFLFRLADLGSRLNNQVLAETARNLLDILPADLSTLEAIRGAAESHSIMLENLFIAGSPSVVLYNYQVLQSLLLPSRSSQTEDAVRMCRNLLWRRGLHLVISGSLTRNNFLQTSDLVTKRQTYRCILRLVKLMVLTIFQSGQEILVQTQQKQSVLRRGFSDEILRNIQEWHTSTEANTLEDWGMNNIAGRVAQEWKDGYLNGLNLEFCRSLRDLAWCAASGSVHLYGCPKEDYRNALAKNSSGPDGLDTTITQEALEALLFALMLTPAALDDIEHNAPIWNDFFASMVFVCRSQPVRATAKVFLCHLGRVNTNKLYLDVQLVLYFFKVVQRDVKNHPDQCEEVFGVLTALLSHFHHGQRSLDNLEEMLRVELDWLSSYRKFAKHKTQETFLVGHLTVIRELIKALPPNQKAEIRTKDGRMPLIRELIEDFLFPAAKILLKVAHRQQRESPPLSAGDASIPYSASSNDLIEAAYSDPAALLDTPHQARPICSTTQSTAAAYEVIVALCLGSAENLNLLNQTLTLLFYSDKEPPIKEWEFSPSVTARKPDGFVGLKNAGATCYMNSVLQQFYMIPEVRNGLLQVSNVIGGLAEEEDLEERGGEGDGSRQAGDFIGPMLPFTTEPDEVDSRPVLVPTKAANPTAHDYNVGMIRQMQVIFSHLGFSRLQFFSPQGFWKHFRLANEPVNLREQHDALEFYNAVVDAVDEGMKSKKQLPLMSNIFGGSFADQKICKDCPHRYSREEPFTALNVDIRNFHTLQDTLESYVKGDLLEGANAYMCEKCQRKVDTVKRLCIKKLPPILTIQLKRFDYDWEREQPIKFNDYFEFPRQIDMEPYTAAGLAKIEGREIPDDNDIVQAMEEMSLGVPKRKTEKEVPTLYRLVGIVVHSGQATGGHYYSYILNRDGDGEAKWHRFDDGDVSECRMDDDEEMKTQCFGGELPQKRWWNAYILFYERVNPEILTSRPTGGRARLPSESIGTQISHMVPSALRSSIVKQNLKFMHNRSQFQTEYFGFLKRLLVSSAHYLTESNNNHLGLSSQQVDECAVATIEMTGRFMFDVCFRTKKALRGAAFEWSEALVKILNTSPRARSKFIRHVLFKTRNRLCEFMLECTAQDVRQAVSRIVAHLAYHSLGDAPCPVNILECVESKGLGPVEVDNVGELILLVCMKLLRSKQAQDNSRNIGSILDVFSKFTEQRCAHVLVKLGVAELLVQIAVDEIPVFKFAHNSNQEISKLFATIANILRTIDFSSFLKRYSDMNNYPIELMPNTLALDQPVSQPRDHLLKLLFGQATFLKKYIEDGLRFEDFRTLISYLSWQNLHFSIMVLQHLLKALSESYMPEPRTVLDAAFSFLMIEDHLMQYRIVRFLTASSDDLLNVEGFLSIMTRSRATGPKRAYLFLKYLLDMMSRDTTLAGQLNLFMRSTPENELRTALQSMCQWLLGEMEGGHSRPNNLYFSSSALHGTTYSWNSQAAQSNENTTGLALERTASLSEVYARLTEFVPEELTEQPVTGADDEEENTGTTTVFNTTDSTDAGSISLPSIKSASHSPNNNIASHIPQDFEQWGSDCGTSGDIQDVDTNEEGGFVRASTPGRRNGTADLFLNDASLLPKLSKLTCGTGGRSYSQHREQLADMGPEMARGGFDMSDDLDEYASSRLRPGTPVDEMETEQFELGPLCSKDPSPVAQLSNRGQQDSRIKVAYDIQSAFQPFEKDMIVRALQTVENNTYYSFIKLDDEMHYLFFVAEGCPIQPDSPGNCDVELEQNSMKQQYVADKITATLNSLEHSSFLNNDDRSTSPADSMPGLETVSCLPDHQSTAGRRAHPRGHH